MTTPLKLAGAVAAAVFVLDQATKVLALDRLSETVRVPVLPSFDLTLAWNYGVSFGMFGSGGTPPWVFVLVSLAICSFLIWQLKRTEERIAIIGYGLIIGGAIGNVVDRLIHGAVVDFLLLYWDRYYWPVFNIADVAITCGVGLILIDSLWPKRASTTS